MCCKSQKSRKKRHITIEAPLLYESEEIEKERPEENIILDSESKQEMNKENDRGKL